MMFLVAGVLLGVLFQPSPSNQVLYFRERDGRGEEYNISDEDPISITTRTNPPLRFFKYGRSYVFTIRRKLGRAKKIARFIGKEGTAYTWRLLGFEEKAKNLNLKFPTLEDAVKLVWGKHFYNTVPEKQKAKLREGKVNVLVDLEPGLTPEEYTPIDEKTVKKKANEDMASLIAAGVKQIVKKSVIDVLPWLGSGIAIGLGLVAIGLLDVGPSSSSAALIQTVSEMMLK